MNILQKIGNDIEENKKRKQSIEDTYWKLKSQDRLEYEFHKEKILKEGRENIRLDFAATKLFVSIYLLLAFIILLLGFSANLPFNDLIEPIRLLSLGLVELFAFAITFDLIIFTLEVIFDRTPKKLKELNKRFYLE